MPDNKFSLAVGALQQSLAFVLRLQPASSRQGEECAGNMHPYEAAARARVRNPGCDLTRMTFTLIGASKFRCAKALTAVRCRFSRRETRWFWNLTCLGRSSRESCLGGLESESAWKIAALLCY